MQERLKGFRGTVTTVGVAYVLLGLLNLAQGSASVLADFGLAPAILSDAHFQDFYHWHFVLMITIGVLMVLLGRLVVGIRPQRICAWTLVAVQLHYLYLDLRTSVWGSGLYDHPKSLVPVAIGALMTLAFLVVAMRRAESSGRSSAG